MILYHISFEEIDLLILSSFREPKYKDLGANPATGITVNRTIAEKNREKRSGKRRPPTHQEADKICTAFPSHRQYQQEDLQDFAIVARYTGMRQAEVAQLRNEDIRLFKKTDYVDQILHNPNNFGQSFKGKIPEGYIMCIFVRDEEARLTKTGEERLIPVAEKLTSTVTKRFKQNSSYLFPCVSTEKKF